MRPILKSALIARGERDQRADVLDLLDLVEDGDGEIDLPEAVLVVGKRFVGGEHPPPMAAAFFDCGPQALEGEPRCPVIRILSGKPR